MVSLDDKREGDGLLCGYGRIFIKVLTCLGSGFMCIYCIINN